MKANQKFLKGDDEAVSPVIAVILMVAITVVLAATVYVWVSGFGASSGSPAKTMSLTGDGALSGTSKTYTVASATSGMRWSDISVTVNGAAINQTAATTNGVSACPTAPEAGTRFLVCSGASTKLSTGIISAGDSFRLTGLSSGQTLRILDAQANSVILTLTIG
jgi:flagellin-like protein